MRLLVDMNLSHRWVKTLNDAGIDAVHWSFLGSGPNNTADIEIMRVARSNDYIVLTNDLDFGVILAMTNRHKPSVVQIRSADLEPDTIGDIVIAALKQVSRELEEGALLTIDSKRTRLSLLPLRRA